VRQLAASIVQPNYLMSRQLWSPPIPEALLISVVCWATLLFTCVGALPNVDALAIIYRAGRRRGERHLCHSRIQPTLPGLFRISPEGIDQVITTLSASKPRGD
jgi:hypothetical protein